MNNILFIFLVYEIYESRTFNSLRMVNVKRKVDIAEE